MELKTYKDFSSNWFSKIYMVDTSYHKDDNNIPYVYRDIIEGELQVNEEDWEKQQGTYCVEYYMRYGMIEHTTRIVVQDDKITCGNWYHIFTDKNEANNFLKKFLAQNDDKIKAAQLEAEKYVVTRKQIAEKFGIPFEKLVIDQYN